MHGRFSHRALFKGIQLLGALALQCDFDQCRKAVAQLLGEALWLQQGHLALDQAFFAQALDAAQRRGGGHMGQASKFLVAACGVGLQQVQQAAVGVV